jgi:hypothetical protein
MEEKSRYERKRWIAYYSALGTLIIITIAEVAFYYREELSAFLYVASSLSIGAGVYAWCTYDSMARRFPLSPGRRLWIGLLGPVFVPVYFIQSRGVAQGARTVFGLLLYAPFYAAFYAVWYATVYLLTSAGYFSAH